MAHSSVSTKARILTPSRDNDNAADPISSKNERRTTSLYSESFGSCSCIVGCKGGRDILDVALDVPCEGQANEVEGWAAVATEAAKRTPASRTLVTPSIGRKRMPPLSRISSLSAPHWVGMPRSLP